MTDFDAFWCRYPRRIGKLAALKAYVKARKLASSEDILQGVDRYLEHKPVYADYCHPATWLNQGRWMDEHEERRSGGDRREVARGGERRDYDWFVECAEIHGGDCGGARWRHEQRKQLDALKAS